MMQSLVFWTLTQASSGWTPHGFLPTRHRRLGSDEMDDVVEIDDIVGRSLYSSDPIVFKPDPQLAVLLKRAETAEAELGKSREEYRVLRQERESFLKERDAELDALEKATAQTQKTQRRLQELEEQMSQMETKLRKAEAKEIQFQNDIEEKQAMIENIRAEFEPVSKNWIFFLVFGFSDFFCVFRLRRRIPLI